MKKRESLWLLFAVSAAGIFICLYQKERAARQKERERVLILARAKKMGGGEFVL